VNEDDRVALAVVLIIYFNVFATSVLANFDEIHNKEGV
jgi:Flp pilus assembly pilin Flp